jgi:hypothetical protein
MLVLKRQSHHLVNPSVWEWWGFDLIALSSYHLGNHDRAVQFGKLALDGSPKDERLTRNMVHYLEANKQKE